MKDGSQKRFWGLIAQDLHEALKEIGHEDSEPYEDEFPSALGLFYIELIAPIVKELQEEKRPTSIAASCGSNHFGVS